MIERGERRSQFVKFIYLVLTLTLTLTLNHSQRNDDAIDHLDPAQEAHQT